MRKTLNKVNISGKIYDHKLKVKTVKNERSDNYGKEFIGGSIDVATDNAGLNIVTVRFSYVTPVTKAGKNNETYAVLKNIIDTNKTILTVGMENATTVNIASAIGINDFYTNKNGEETLVSAMGCEGGFVKIVSSVGEDEDARCKFEADMLINNVKRVEADPERNIDKDYIIVKGAVFDFRNALLPLEFIVHSESGMKYFESLEASSKNPIFTKVWGKINSSTIVTRKEEESAFGEPSVKEYVNKKREWVITGTSKPEAIYPIGDSEAGITEEEIKKAMADREVHLAEVKNSYDEYQTRQAGGSTTVATAPAAMGGFDF